MFRKLYDWVLKWADTPYGTWALFIIAFCESSFFPVPPDILLIALAVAVPARAFRYALICSAGSLLGGFAGYFIGWQFMASIGNWIISLYGFGEKMHHVETLYQTYDAWIVFIAGFTPIPYKVITISAGMFKINFPVFALASAVSRSARFFLVSGLIFAFGASIQAFIDRYFNLIATAFTILLVGGFVLIKYAL